MWPSQQLDDDDVGVPESVSEVADHDASEIETVMPGRKSSSRTLGVHLGHDSAMAIVIDGAVITVLELERLFEVQRLFWVNPRSDCSDVIQTVSDAACVIRYGTHIHQLPWRSLHFP